MRTKEEILFEEAPVGRAVLTLVIPTIISQLITVIYNMADTFFIGQIGDANQVAAVSLCMPIFVFLTGFANLFGIGGSSLMARSLGTGDHKKSKTNGGVQHLDRRRSVADLWAGPAADAGNPSPDFGRRFRDL